MLIINDKYKNNKMYDGNSPKFGITVKGTDYIVKLSKDNGMTVYCEYIASKFIKKLGIMCHDVEIGLYSGSYMGQEKQNEVVDVIRDFTSGTSYTLHTFGDTNQSSEDTILPKEYTYDDIVYMIDKHLKMTDKNKQEAKEMFWDMFICDAILANRDRHKRNWGYLSNGVSYRAAPLYDNGSSLFPDVNRVIGQYINNETRKDFLYQRVYAFPACLLMRVREDAKTNVTRPFRTNYAEMFSDLRINKIFADRVKRIKCLYSDEWVFNTMRSIVENLPIDLVYKRFYIEIVTLRYKCIVLREKFNKSYNTVEGWLV